MTRTIEPDFLYRGAEATLTGAHFHGFDAIIKTRNPKTYRNPLLDERIRKSRTRDEASILSRVARVGMNVPTVLLVDSLKSELVLEEIKGTRLKEYFWKKKDTNIAQLLGEQVGLLHKARLVHGDLTTSNAIVRGGKVVLIDFGLAFDSSKLEDQAVDLLGLKKTYRATHANFPAGWKNILKGYLKAGGKQATINHIQKIEERARYS